MSVTIYHPGLGRTHAVPSIKVARAYEQSGWLIRVVDRRQPEPESKPQPAEHRCLVCGFGAKSAAGLTLHLRVHDNVEDTEGGWGA